MARSVHDADRKNKFLTEDDDITDQKDENDGENDSEDSRDKIEDDDEDDDTNLDNSLEIPIEDDQIRYNRIEEADDIANHLQVKYNCTSLLNKIEQNA